MLFLQIKILYNHPLFPPLPNSIEIHNFLREKVKSWICLIGLLSLELILYRNNIELLSWSVALINQKFYVKNNHIRENSSKYQRIIFQIWFSSSFFFYQELVKPLFFFFSTFRARLVSVKFHRIELFWYKYY